MKPALLDTDTVSEILKQKNLKVREKAWDYLNKVGPLCYSLITQHEILRGLKWLGNQTFLDRFARFSESCEVVPVDSSILELAADLWVLARRKGLVCADADLWIGATAVARNRVLVTGNTRHFEWIPGLELDNWRVDVPMDG